MLEPAFNPNPRFLSRRQLTNHTTSTELTITAPLAYPAPLAAPAPAIIDSMAKLLAPGVPAYGASPLYGFARKA